MKSSTYAFHGRGIESDLLDAPSSGCALPSGLGSELFTGGFATGGLASSLLGTRHLKAARATESLVTEAED